MKKTDCNIRAETGKILGKHFRDTLKKEARKVAGDNEEIYQELIKVSSIRML